MSKTIAIFDEYVECTIKSRTLFLDSNTESPIDELKEKYGFMPIYNMDDLSRHAPINEHGEHEFPEFHLQSKDELSFKNILVFLTDDDSLLGNKWIWEPSEKEPFRRSMDHPLMLMVRSARKQFVRVVYIAKPEMRNTHPLLLKSDFFSWAPESHGL